MLENERLIIRQFSAVLRDHVFPNEVLPYLLCLTDDDCDQIRAKQRMEGPREAVSILLDRLKRRDGSFKQFLTALEQTGCGHVKTKLENALRDQTRPETQPTTVTPETSSSPSDILKTPTTETTSPFSESLPKTKKSITLDPPKKSNDKSKPRKNKTPKENTTSPTSSKTCTNTPKKKSSPTTSKSIPTSKNSKKPKSPEMPSLNPVKVTSAANSICNQVSKRADQTKNSNAPSETSIDGSTATLYDTFICYAQENCDVATELRQFLKTEFNLQVCIDFVDFIPGVATTDNICKSISSSASIIFLLSPYFLKKHLATWELKNAVYYSRSKSNKCKKIIPAMLEECALPKELELYTAIKMESSESNEEFWRKLATAVVDGNGQVDEKNEDIGDDVDIDGDDKDVNDGTDDGTDDGNHDGTDDGNDDNNHDGTDDGTDDGEIIDGGIDHSTDDEIIGNENACNESDEASSGDTGGCEDADNSYNSVVDGAEGDCDETPVNNADDNDDDTDDVSDDVDYNGDNITNDGKTSDDMDNNDDKTKIKPVNSQDNVKSLQSL